MINKKTISNFNAHKKKFNSNKQPLAFAPIKAYHFSLETELIVAINIFLYWNKLLLYTLPSDTILSGDLKIHMISQTHPQKFINNKKG